MVFPCKKRGFKGRVSCCERIGTDWKGYVWRSGGCSGMVDSGACVKGRFNGTFTGGIHVYLVCLGIRHGV